LFDGGTRFVVADYSIGVKTKDPGKKSGVKPPQSKFFLRR
jgi:hypothetical protein